MFQQSDKSVLYILICFVIFILAISSLTGCAHYAYKNGDCSLSVWSMREIKAGDIRITKNCSLTGGADGMTYNEQQMMIFQELVKKIP